MGVEDQPPCGPSRNGEFCRSTARRCMVICRGNYARIQREQKAREEAEPIPHLLEDDPMYDPVFFHEDGPIDQDPTR